MKDECHLVTLSSCHLVSLVASLRDISCNGKERADTVSRSVIAYVTDWCPDCFRSRRVLQRAGVPFKEINIEKVAGAEEEMKRLNGGSGKVPTISVNGRILVEPSDLELACALKEE
jgi:mycoredoxin